MLALTALSGRHRCSLAQSCTEAAKLMTVSVHRATVSCIVQIPFRPLALEYRDLRA